MTLRVLVCGGREYRNWAAVRRALDALLLVDEVLVVHGAARGADSLAWGWGLIFAQETGFPALWRPNGALDRGAGFKRNTRMLREGAPHLIVAFPGGKGTANMVAQGRAAGVGVWRPAQ